MPKTIAITPSWYWPAGISRVVGVPPYSIYDLCVVRNERHTPQAPAIIDAQGTPPHRIAVQRLDRSGRIGLGHFDEPEAARTARVTVDRQGHGLDRAVLGEQVPHRGFVSRERQVAYIDFRHL